MYRESVGAGERSTVKDRNRLKETILRLIILSAGLTVAHLGVTLFLMSDMGADPFNVLIQGIKLLLQKAGPSLSHGTVHAGICFLIILILLIVDRRYVRAGTVVCMFCGGPIIDLFSWLLNRAGIAHAAFPVKILILAAGCVILAFGMTIVIRSEAGTGPNDLVAVVISEKSGFRFGTVRICTDVLFVLVGFLLGGKFGVGTVICAFLVGPAAEFFMPVSSALVRRSLDWFLPNR